MWLVPASVIVHRDPEPFVRADSLRARLREFRSPPPLAGDWKHLYALRNLLYLARRHRILNWGQAASFASIQVIRRLLVGERRLRSGRLAAAYAYDGMRGRFRNVTPEAWAEIAAAQRPLRELDARALRYDRDVRDHDQQIA